MNRLQPRSPWVSSILAATVSFLGTAAIVFGVTNADDAGATDSNDPLKQSTTLTGELPAKENPSSEVLALDNFPLNSRGQTYGSDANATGVEDAPDLIGVVGDNGVFGYVLKEDLWPPSPRTPEEARAQRLESERSGPPTFDVWDQEAVKVVDSFTLSQGQSVR